MFLLPGTFTVTLGFCMQPEDMEMDEEKDESKAHTLAAKARNGTQTSSVKKVNRIS